MIKDLKAVFHEVRRAWIYIVITSILFAAAIYIGFTSNEFNELLRSQVEGLESIAQQLNQTENTQFWVFLFIFLNNAIKAVLIMFAGLFFGLIPLVFIVMNGMVLGFVFRNALEQGRDLSVLIVKGILPHGILEVPAILIAGALGLKLGGLMWNSLLRRNSRGTLTGFLKSLGKVSVVLVSVLLIAAVIESTVTFWLLKG
ncbi:stage II sporulation protein M [Paenibacillus turpanensis]|uniref:stage II sporulation protein M n=1 Tax=Paenibacillus turpanensis TaxID=2689078 RepID=UPI00140CE104|nr:stage II sporulation protein M [Paenibacillus turpanensis]